MLIEGAIRFGRQAADALHRGDELAADGPLMRVIDIVGELLAGLRQQNTELNKRIAEVYWYLFRTVSAAKINADAAKLAAAIELLEYERQTWQIVCQKLRADTAGEIARKSTAPLAPPRHGLPTAPWSSLTDATGITLEA